MVEIEVGKASSSINQLVKDLNTLKSALNGSLNSAKSNNLNKNLDKSTKTLGKLFKIGIAYKGLKSVYTSLIEPSIDLIETTNLFEVQMGKVVDQYGNLDNASSAYYTKALAFQEKMNEKLATNMQETMEYQAKYFAMFKNQGIDLDSSYFMAENLTEAGYDISSLYNLTTQESMDKIRAGLAGQVEPLRAIGIDISEGALKKVLNDVGIERSVQQLSYAEKEIARYIAIVEQAGKAQGDFAKTFESPANQVKVFKNQLQELRQVAGSLITGLFGKIVVYANAVIMTLKEMLKAIARLFNVDLNYTQSLSSANEGIGNIEESIGGATKKAKEFKKQLMGFDEIHNITLPDNSGGSGASVGGIDDRLLQSLKDWDNQMDAISGKAQEIRDRMLEWLGFTEDVNGNLQWSWKEMDNMAKSLLIISGIVAGINLVGKIVKIIEVFKMAKGVLKSSDFVVGLSAVSKAFATLKTYIVLGIEQFKLFRLAGDGVFLALSKTFSGLWGLIAPIVTPIAGIVSILSGAFLFISGIKDIITKVEAPLAILGKILSGIALIAAGVAAFFGAIPAAIAAVVAAIVAAVTAIVVYWEEIKIFFTVTMPKAIQDFGKWLSQKWSEFVTWLGTVPEKVGYWLGDAVGAVVKFFTQTIPEAWRNFWQWIGEKWSQFIEWLKGLPEKIWNGLVSIANKISHFFTVTIPETWSKFIEWLKGLPAKFVEFGKNIIQGLITGIQNAWNGFWTAVKDFINGFTKGFKDALGIHSPSTIFEGFGKNIVQGLINGIKNMGTTVKNTITNLGSNILSWFKEKLGIHSPSTMMRDFVGKFIPLGMAEGIDNEANSVYESIEQLTKGVRVNAQDLIVDTNQFVDYGNISGEISARSNVNIGTNIIQGITQAVKEAFRDTNINVEVEAKTEEGVIVKKVSQGLTDYVMQTGELPFPIPI